MFPFYEKVMKIFYLSRLYKFRLILINFSILVSIFFVILKNIEEIRFTKIINDEGDTFILDRFTSKIRKSN